MRLLQGSSPHLALVGEVDLGGVLLPGLPVDLHGGRVQQEDLDLHGLAHPVRLAQPHLGDKIKLLPTPHD